MTLIWGKSERLGLTTTRAYATAARTSTFVLEDEKKDREDAAEKADSHESERDTEECAWQPPNPVAPMRIILTIPLEGSLGMGECCVLGACI